MWQINSKSYNSCYYDLLRLCLDMTCDDSNIISWLEKLILKNKIIQWCSPETISLHIKWNLHSCFCNWCFIAAGNHSCKEIFICHRITKNNKQQHNNKKSHTFCFLSFWWPVVLMGGTLGWGWTRAVEEEEQLKLLTEFHLDPVA